MLALSNQSQQLYAAQMDLLDILPDDTPTSSEGDMEIEKEGMFGLKEEQGEGEVPGHTEEYV